MVRSRTRIGGVVVAMLVVVALATVAPVAVAGGTGPSAPVPGVTEDAVKVGGIGTLSSPFGFSQPNIDVGFVARIDRANDAGGVHGRRIDFIGMKDDKIAAATSAQLARELVQQDEVFLLAPVVSPVFGAGDFLEQEGVPFLGWGVTEAFCGNEYAFGFDGCLFPTDQSGRVSTLQGGLVADYLREQGENPEGMTVAIQSEDIPAGDISKTVVGRAYEAAGLDVVYSESSVPVVPGFDWSPYVRAIMTSASGGPPDIVNVGMTVPNAVGLIGALNAAGYEGLMLSPVTYDASVIDDASANESAQGSFVFTNYAPKEQRTKATKQLLRDVKKVDPDVVVDYQVIVGYWIADMLVDMLEKAGPDLTRESFLEAANSGTFGVKGGYGPTKYPAAHEAGGRCGSLVLIKGTKFVPQVPFTCYRTVPFSG